MDQAVSENATIFVRKPIEHWVAIPADTQVFVKTLSGKSITLNVCRDDDVLGVKEIIQIKEGWRIRFWFIYLHSPSSSKLHFVAAI